MLNCVLMKFSKKLKFEVQKCLCKKNRMFSFYRGLKLIFIENNLH